MSRIICRSRNGSLLCKRIESFAKVSDDGDEFEHYIGSETKRSRFGSLTADDQVYTNMNAGIEMALLVSAFQRRLRLAINDRNDSISKTRNKKLRTKRVEYEGYNDFNSKQDSINRDKPQQLSIRNDCCSFSRCLSTWQLNEEVESILSYHGQSLNQISLQKRSEIQSGEESTVPLKEIVINNLSKCFEV